jgi:hypothetical protein
MEVVVGRFCLCGFFSDYLRQLPNGSGRLLALDTGPITTSLMRNFEPAGTFRVWQFALLNIDYCSSFSSIAKHHSVFGKPSLLKMNIVGNPGFKLCDMLSNGLQQCRQVFLLMTVLSQTY